MAGAVAPHAGMRPAGGPQALRGMLHGMRKATALGLLAPLVLAVASAAPGAAAEPGFDMTWHDGKAELDGYRLTIERYGHPRQGRAVAIYVTEPLDRKSVV